MIRIRDLARHLDISIGTVSRALNDKSDVNALTRERVREAAARLGYSPNQSGRSLRRGRTDLVGITVPTSPNERLIDAVFYTVLDGLRRRLAVERYDLAIFLQGRGEDAFASLKRIAERGLFDGLVISDTLVRDPRIDYLVEKRCPFVTFGRSRSGGGHAWVDPDFVGAVEGAVETLRAAGHDAIGLVSPNDPLNYVRLTKDAFPRALRKRGLAVEAMWSHEVRTGSESSIDAWLGQERLPSAAVVSGLRASVEVYAALARHGMTPGRDLSVISILPEAPTIPLSPPLAAYQTDWAAIGGRLGDALLRSLDAGGGAAPRPIQEIAPVFYLPGESVATRRR